MSNATLHMSYVEMCLSIGQMVKTGLLSRVRSMDNLRESLHHLNHISNTGIQSRSVTQTTINITLIQITKTEMVNCM